MTSEPRKPQRAKRSVADQFFLLGASSTVTMVATAVSGVLIARALGVEARGLVALVIFWSTFSSSLGNLSLPDAQIAKTREYSDDPATLIPTALTVALVLAFLTSILAVIGLFVFGERFEGTPLLFDMVFFTVFMTGYMVNNVYISVERASLNFDVLAGERIIVPICYASLLLLPALMGWLTPVMTLTIFLVSRWPVLIKRVWRYRGYLRGRISGSFMPRILRTALGFQSVTMVGFLNAQADRLVVSTVWLVSSVGYFSVAYSAAGFGFSLITQSINMMMLPMVSAMDAETKAERVAQSLRITTMVGSVIVAGVILTAPFLIPLVYGAKFEPAAEMTQLIAITFLPGLLISQLDGALRGAGRTRAAFIMQCTILTIFGLGWLATGYRTVLTLGIGLAISRVCGLVGTLLLERNSPMAIRVRDAFVWRKADFLAVYSAARDLAGRLLRRAKRVLPGG